MVEAFVGSGLLALPVLVEDGVFGTAAHFVEFTVSSVPVVLIANVPFVGLLPIGVRYWTDIRSVSAANPLFDVVPRRLVGTLMISFGTVGLLFIWGRLSQVGSTTEAFARLTVIWTVGAFGAALGDILPGESDGRDVTIDTLDEIVGSA